MQIIGAFAVLVIGLLIASVLSRAAERALTKHPRFDPTIAELLSRMVKYALWAVVLVTVLSQFGVQTASILAALGGMALAGAGLATDAEAGEAKIRAVLADGRAAERFGKMVGAMGGPLGFVERWAWFLPEATVIREFKADQAGYIAAMDGETMGLAVIELGGGRQVESDVIEPSVGLSDILPLGAEVAEGQPVLRIHAARAEHADRAEAMLRRAITIGASAPEVPPLVHERVG